MFISGLSLSLGLDPSTLHAAPIPIAPDAPLHDLATAPEGRLIWNKVGSEDGAEHSKIRAWRSDTGTTLSLTTNASLRNRAVVVSWPYILFFEGDNTLRRMAPSGRLLDPPLATGTGSGLGRKGQLAPLDDFAYWSDNGGIHRVPVDGGASQVQATLWSWSG